LIVGLKWFPEFVEPEPWLTVNVVLKQDL